MTLLYPGSFDPVTRGHIDIAERGAKITTRLIVAVLDNPNKQPFFNISERIELLSDALKHVSNIEVTSFSGLLVDFAQSCSATAILRGLRSPNDFEIEARYAASNMSLAGVETIFLSSDPSLAYISSSIVREAAYHMHNNMAPLNKMVTQNVIDKLAKNPTARSC